MSRPVAALATLLALGGGLAGCAGPRAQLVVDARPPDADVFVDDVFVGAAGALEKKRVRLTPGPHRIEVRREGYYHHYADVVVPADARRTELRVQLRRRVLDPGTDDPE